MFTEGCGWLSFSFLPSQSLINSQSFLTSNGRWGIWGKHFYIIYCSLFPWALLQKAFCCSQQPSDSSSCLLLVPKASPKTSCFPQSHTLCRVNNDKSNSALRSSELRGYKKKKSWGSMFWSLSWSEAVDDQTETTRCAFKREHTFIVLLSQCLIHKILFKKNGNMFKFK